MQWLKGAFTFGVSDFILEFSRPSESFDFLRKLLGGKEKTGENPLEVQDEQPTLIIWDSGSENQTHDISAHHLCLSLLLSLKLQVSFCCFHSVTLQTQICQCVAFVNKCNQQKPIDLIG